MRKRIFSTFFLIAFLSGNFPPFVYAQEVSNNIRALLSNQGKTFYGDESNSILVIDYPENIERVAEYLAVLDVHPQQVLIEARVVEVKLQKEHSLGVNWKAFADKGYLPIGRFKTGASTGLGNTPAPFGQTSAFKPTFFPPGQSTTGQESPFTFSIFDDNINIVVQTLANALDTDILSAPRVTTVNNREAEIKIIQRLPWAEPTLTQTTGTGGGSSVSVTWEVNFEEVGIILKATPTINEDGKITMLLNPEVSERTSDITLTVVQGQASQTYTVPVIDRRSASTKVVIGNGQTLIIGGLIKDKSTKGETKIPLLGDIPYLGYLFKSKKDTREKTEMLIFVSPKIITSEEILQMSGQEKALRDKDYLKQRQQQQEITLQQEEEKKKKNNGLAEKLEGLSEKQKALSAQREKLEAEVAKEEEELTALTLIENQQ